MWIKIEEWLTPMEYSRHIGKSMSWVTKLMQEKKIDYIKYSGGRLIHKSGKFPDYIKNQDLIRLDNGVHKSI